MITGRRVVEWGVLLEELTRGCHSCGLGPLTLSLFSVVGELVKGLGGYLYVECSVCRFISRIKYGKAHHRDGKATGMPEFDVNTKLGISECHKIHIECI